LDLVLQQFVNGLVLGCEYTLIALGMTMIFGILNVLNFAHGAFYMLGAYLGLTFVKFLGLTYWPSVILTIVGMIVFAYIVNRIFFKPFYSRGHNSQMVSTIALSIILTNMALLIWTPDPQRLASAYNDVTISIGPVMITLQRILVIAVTAILVLILFYIMAKTSLGRAIRATSQDRLAAEFTGVNVKTISFYVIAIGCVLAGVAGVLVSPLFLVYPEMSTSAIGKAFVIVILGGMGNVPGAIFGGLLVGMIESFTVQYLGSYLKEIVVFAIMIIILLVRPSGLFGTPTKKKV
jgi:branched-chain amino acid transport system permease protein